MVTLFGVLICFTNAFSVVEWNVRKTFKLKKPPLDVAVASNGRWIFVLADGGNLLIYSADGMLKESILVGKHIDGITTGQKEDIVFLFSQQGATVQQVQIDFIYDIDTAEAPFKGPKDAPVVIAVFNDFQ
jgi:hypothetical protein